MDNQSKDPIVYIYTDGACSGNPGPGGWAALLRWQEHEKVLSGYLKHTTNNIMELTAIISALEALKRPMQVELFTDSRYALDGITKWIIQWKKNDWKTKDKKPVKNLELWQRLDLLNQTHQITWHWVEGHSGHPENEQVDQLARQAIQNAK